MQLTIFSYCLSTQVGKVFGTSGEGSSMSARAGHGDTVTVRRPLFDDNIVSQSILF